MCACHRTDIAIVHGARSRGRVCDVPASVWNWAKNGDCIGCHNGVDVGSHAYSPTDPNHYAETTHTAEPFTAAVQAGVRWTSALAGSSARSVTARPCGPRTARPRAAAGLSRASSATPTRPSPRRRPPRRLTRRKCVECHEAGAATTHDFVRDHPRGGARHLCGNRELVPRLHGSGRSPLRRPVWGSCEVLQLRQC